MPGELEMVAQYRGAHGRDPSINRAWVIVGVVDPCPPRIAAHPANTHQITEGH